MKKSFIEIDASTFVYQTGFFSRKYRKETQLSCAKLILHHETINISFLLRILLYFLRTEQ